ncbi:MAG: AMP-binding protein, partial [Pseudomonadota bacterium]
MQDYPLNIHKLLEYSEQNNASEEIVSKRLEGDVHRYTYKDLGRRSRQLASALKKAGVEPGDVAGTIAWNGYRHVELYFALPGIGALYHTINPRLTDEQLAYVINHADDTMVFIEASFVERLEAIGSSLKSIKMIVVLCDEADLPSSENLPLVSYEAFIATGDPAYQWQEFDEKTACAICYTSGTTGNPKGVVYSHRALILQAFSFIIGAELT